MHPRVLCGCAIPARHRRVRLCDSPLVDLRNRQVGLFVKLPSTQAVEIAAAAGFDFCVLDLEHSQLDEGAAIALAAHAAALHFPAIVRLPELDRGAVNRLLEAGASGIQLSTVRSARQVRELRRAMRHAPEGDRSVSLAHTGARYGATPLAEYLDLQRERPPVLVAQIETAETDDPLKDILAAGPDVAFIGTTDLSTDLGLDAGALRDRVGEISASVAASGVALGAFGLDDPRVTYRVLSSDLALLRSAAEQSVAKHRDSPGG
jgi:4-hydroxy-2-oxoheptanedioate aldolase